MSSALAGRTPGQLFALVFGAVYLLVGVAGFFVGSEGTLIVLDVNALHNVAHVAIGAALLAGSRAPELAKTINLVVGVVSLVLAILGFAGVVVEDLLNANAADHVLHLATALLAIYFGTAGAGVRTATA